VIVSVARVQTFRSGAVLFLAVGVFVFSWLYRFNDPGGGFAGLTDDHFFYLVRGWQILFGDLPVRDFVDHGAPLYYYIGAGVQMVFGRGTLSEVAFSATVLALGSALTFWLATTASGSILAGLTGAVFQMFLDPRFYNYPKILAYAVAIPLMWRFVDTPSSWRRSWVALATAGAFLLRHDHGVFVALAMGVLLLAVRGLSWRERCRHAALYAVTTLLFLAPYLVFVELSGGVTSYFRQAAAWAERDRDRAPVVWPGLFENPDGVSESSRSGSSIDRAVGTVRDNVVAWTFYAELVLPFVALLVLGLTKDAGRVGWPHARAKILSAAVLALVLDAFFLRSPLDARLADPSVPLAILVAWLLAVVPRLLVSRAALAPHAARAVWPWRAAVVVGVLPLMLVLGAGTTKDLYDRIDKAGLTDRFGKGFDRAGSTSAQLRQDWRLESWLDRPDRPELLDLSLYVSACTTPTDRVLVQAYVPQVLALARRAFAGGHADLRPGFFKTEDAQRLTIERLRAQSVPIILLETGQSYQNFRQSFPLVIAHIDAQYREVGTKVFDGRFGTTLFVRRDRTPRSTYAPFGWPCYGSGVVGS
jgi:hypothetical protein